MSTKPLRSHRQPHPRDHRGLGRPRRGSLLARLIGLMLARPLPPGAGLVIVPCSSIHTQFMRFPIDVLYVNKEDVIVGIDRNLRPWRIGRFYKKVHYVVESPPAALTPARWGIRLRSRDPCRVMRAPCFRVTVSSP